MRPEPYVPGAPAPLDPPRLHRDPAAVLDHADLVAAARRLHAIEARIGFAIAGLGFLAAALCAAGAIT